MSDDHNPLRRSLLVPHPMDHPAFGLLSRRDPPDRPRPAVEADVAFSAVGAARRQPLEPNPREAFRRLILVCMWGSRLAAVGLSVVAVASMAVGCGAGSSKNAGDGVGTSAGPAKGAAPSQNPSLSPGPMRTSRSGGFASCGPFPPRHAWVQAVGSDGTLRWQVPLPVARDSGNESLPPLVVNGLAVSAVDGGLTAVGLSDGHRVWHWRGGDSIYGMWSAGDRVVVLTDQVSTHARLSALDAATGDAVWRVPIPGSGLLGDQVSTRDGGLAWMQADGNLQAVQLDDGRVRWTHSTGRVPALAVAGSNVLLGRSGTVTAYDTRTGDVAWSAHGLPQDPALTVAAGRVLVTSDVSGGDSPTSLTALNPATGHLQWRYDVGMDPTVVGGEGDSLLVATYVPKRRLSLIDAATGRSQWTVNTAVSLDTHSLVTSDSVITVEGGVSGYPRIQMVERARRTGQQRWQHALSSAVGREPLNVLGSLVVVQQAPAHPNQSSSAIAYDIATGQRQWTQKVPTLVQAPAISTGSVLLILSADPGYACAL